MKRHAALVVAVVVMMPFGSLAQEASSDVQTPKARALNLPIADDGLPPPVRTINVVSLEGLEHAIAAAKPGDHIVLADGTYTSAAPIKIAQKGTPQHPILVSPQTVGGAEIGGAGSFELADGARDIVLQGFVFKHAPPAVTIAATADHCRISRNLFELALKSRSTYCSVAGSDCEVDHNEFRSKKTEGEMLLVVGPGTSEMAERTWIHHNYFHDFKSPPANNCSAIQIGMSGRSMSSGWSITEHNLFVKCAGENEGCICNKSSDNTYRFNTFGEGSTELSIRHGNRCQVYANFFIGCDGVRVFGHDHKIFCNYFEHCRPAIHLGNGDGIIPPAKLTAHDKPVGVQIVFNTLVDNRANLVMRGRNRGLGAADAVIANNVIVGGPKAAAIEGPLQDPVWEGNIVWNNEGGAGDVPAAGSKSIDPLLKADATGQRRPEKASPVIGAAAGSFPYVTVDVNGRKRGDKLDTGAEQISSQPATNVMLKPDVVGVSAIETRKVPTFPIATASK